MSSDARRSLSMGCHLPQRRRELCQGVQWLVILFVFAEVADVSDAYQGVLFFLSFAYHGRGTQCVPIVPAIN